MQFMEAFNCAKKLNATLRLPGKNYVFVPHEDNSIAVKDYNGNILQEIKDSQEFIKISCQFTTDDWISDETGWLHDGFEIVEEN